MKSPNNLILSSTVHDPNFALKGLLTSTLPMIKKLFSRRIVCCTDTTNESFRTFLLSAGFQVSVCSSMRQVDVYTEALENALTSVDNPTAQKIFFIDFDRLLHWLDKYPDELINILNIKSNIDYLHLGRSSRAYETHPFTQKKTELIINEVGSNVLEFSETKDIISACSLFNINLAKKLIQVKNLTAKGFYGTWPILLWDWATEKEYLEVEGLEWETPDRFLNEISKKGYEAWLKQFQTPNEWEKRVSFVREFFIELNNLIKYNIRKN